MYIIIRRKKIMDKYKLKVPNSLGENISKRYKKIEQTFIDNFLEKKDENSNDYRLKSSKLSQKVVCVYKKIENGTTSTYKKIEDKFVDMFLEKTSS